MFQINDFNLINNNVPQAMLVYVHKNKSLYGNPGGLISTFDFNRKLVCYSYNLKMTDFYCQKIKTKRDKQ